MRLSLHTLLVSALSQRSLCLCVEQDISVSTEPCWRLDMTDTFVELHARSAFSFLEGSCVPEELAGACASLGMPAMAIMDRNGVYGAPRFHMAAKKMGVRAHIGSEITCTNGRTYPLLAESREG